MDQRGFWMGCKVFSEGEQAWHSSLCPCSYYAVVVYKILNLLIEEFGGSNAFLTRFSGKPFSITTGPCCCCCLCLPRVPMSRYLHHYSLHTLFYSECSFAQTVPMIFCPQADVILAEDWITSVCNPKDGVFYLLSSIMDQWQLSSVKRKKMLQFWKMKECNMDSKPCSEFPLASGH